MYSIFLGDKNSYILILKLKIQKDSLFHPCFSNLLFNQENYIIPVVLCIGALVVATGVDDIGGLEDDSAVLDIGGLVVKFSKELDLYNQILKIFRLVR